MAPNWLDFAALVKGHTPPRRREGASFRYLELGCGMGFGLCLLAALYPEGRFVGIDFQPDHIAHARQLAEELALENVRFLEADFLALQRDPAPLGFNTSEGGIYHYVVAHGIATWVSEPVQQALLALASAALLNGGLFYCSYNTLPGWLPMTAYQQLVRLELQRGETSLPAEALRRSVQTLSRLLGDAQQATPLRDLLPTLPSELEELRLDDIQYLLGEYDNAGWQPLYVAEMHRRCAAHKLSPVATANLPELFEELLPQPLRSQVSEEPNPLIRQTLIDLATARAFRRDLFARGSCRLSPEAWRRRLSALRLRLKENPARSDWSFNTNIGTLSVPAEVCLALEGALDGEALSLAELAQATGQPVVEIVRLAALLLEAGRIGLDRGTAGQEALASCERVNARLLQRQMEGWPYGSLAAAAIGSSVDWTLLEALYCQAPGQGHLGDAAARWIVEQLEQLGASRPAQAGSGGGRAYASEQEILKLASTFQRDRLPALLRLGVSLPRFPSRTPGHGHSV